MRPLFITCLLAISGQLVGCAGTASTPRTAADVASAEEVELANQERAQQQERRLRELQRRLAAAEAENDDLRRESPPPRGLRETVRIADESDGFRYFEDDGEGWDVMGEPDVETTEPARTEDSGPRPLLQLHGTPQPSLGEVGSLAPVPTGTPLRLAAAPVPPLPAGGAAPGMMGTMPVAPNLGAYGGFGPAPQAGFAPAPAPVDRDALGQDAYRRAVGLMRERRLNEAYGAFERFLASHADHRFAARARFWQAEVLYLQRRYGDALAMYERYVARHRSSQQAPEALLKMSLCYQRMGRRSEAQAVLSRLVREYPASVAAQSLRQGQSR